jgi:acyl-coenzyme A synthetase/AMP-(fatty) acid ligase
MVPEGEGHELDAMWPEDDQQAACFFTSGSTGEPKLVTKRGYQFLRQAFTELPWLGVAEGAQVLSLVPPYHILGFMYGLVVPLVHRGSTAFTRGSTPEAWTRFIRDRQPDVVVAVPSHYRFLAQSLDGPLPPALFLSSGAPLPPEVDQAFYGVAGQRINQIYGSTETGGVARRVGAEPWQPFPGLAWAVGPEDGCLRVLSPWQVDVGTWFVSDDLATAEGEGFRLLGRADSIVKVGGKRFSTNEVVTAAQAIPGVETAVVVDFQRPSGENALALFATLAQGTLLTSSDLRASLRKCLPAFKVPRTIRVVAELPLLSTGKVDIQALRRQTSSTPKTSAPGKTRRGVHKNSQVRRRGVDGRGSS